MKIGKLNQRANLIKRILIRIDQAKQMMELFCDSLIEFVYFPVFIESIGVKIEQRFKDIQSQTKFKRTITQSLINHQPSMKPQPSESSQTHQQPSVNGTSAIQPQQSNNQQQHQSTDPIEAKEQTHSQVSHEQQIPDHFYDSDIASVCEKDFLSDNEPPKDIVQERKLLYKEKLLHVFKTIVRIGSGIDKPARYDWTKMKHRIVPKGEVVEMKNKKGDHKEGDNNDEKEKEEVKKEQQAGGQEQMVKNEEGQTNTESEKQQQQQVVVGEQPSTKLQEQGTAQQQQPPTTQQPPQFQQSQPPQLKDHIPLQQPLPQQQQHHLPPYYSTAYLQFSPIIEYNIGNQHEQIQRLVTSMKKGQTALFQLEYLTVSKKSNIKIKARTEVHVIHVFDWTTVIDLDGDRKLLKYVLRKGEGAFRVALYDRIDFGYELFKGGIEVEKREFVGQRLEKEFIEEQLLSVVWRVLTSMKDKEQVRLEAEGDVLREMEGEEGYAQLEQIYKQKIAQLSQQNQQNSQSTQPTPYKWTLTLTINTLTKVDDIHLDGRILKETLVRGVSTAKPESSSLVYYALKFINLQQEVLKADQCFESDWWQDFGKLDELPGIRRSHLDDYSVSKMLRKAIKRMKPAEVAMVECRDKELFTYGQDYQQLKQLLAFTEPPSTVKIIIRIYNFTEARTAFNMQIEQKIIESKRKKEIALRLLQQNNLTKALKRFESIIAFYSSEKINQEAYDQKVSALMNAILCHMKMKKFKEMVDLCNQILVRPRHGHQFKDMKIVGPGHAKIQGTVPQGDDGEGVIEQNQAMVGDTRRVAMQLTQNQKTVDKCLYRKGWALVQLGECEQALKSLNQISQAMSSTEEVVKLKAQAQKGKEKYEEKSKKIFKSMFG